MKKSKSYKGLIIVSLVILLFFILSYQFRHKLFKNMYRLLNNAVEDSGGQLVSKNTLIVLGGSRQSVESVIKEYNGEIVYEVPETTSYRVKFPVSNYDELLRIKNDLNKKGIQAVSEYIQKPPRPGEPQ